MLHIALLTIDVSEDIDNLFHSERLLEFAASWGTQQFHEEFLLLDNVVALPVLLQVEVLLYLGHQDLDLEL